MKRGNDEEKTMGPMFPRLHVNDTEKGGPKAPPRNKMALYEQLSIPSQRFIHTAVPFNTNNTRASLVPRSSQSSVSERFILPPHQLLPRFMSEKQHGQYSDISSPLANIHQRKRLDEDDFIVPVFVHSMTVQEWGKKTNNMDREKVSPVSASNLWQSWKISEPVGRGVIGDSLRQEEKPQESSLASQNELVQTVSNSSVLEKTPALQKQTNLTLTCELGNTPSNCTNSLKTANESQPGGGGQSTTGLEEKRNPSSISLTLEDQNTARYPTNNVEYPEDDPWRTLQKGSQDWSDSISETSNVITVSELCITPDDVVGVIGQKLFWKARRAISSQQRVFAFQVFELHRLVKVQKGMAQATCLLEEGETMTPTPPEDPSLNYHAKFDTSNGKGELGNLSYKIVCQTEFEPPPESYKPASGNSDVCRTRTTTPQGQHQWLIPVMSPSEGLVYKPYPEQSFVGPIYGGYNLLGSRPFVGAFSAPAFGIPVPQPLYQSLPFSSPLPRDYFPSYAMPIMHTALSNSSVEQTKPLPSAKEASLQSQNETIHVHSSEDLEVQGSMASSQNERLQLVETTRTVLPLFPTSPTMGSSHYHHQAPPRVIKVVPHHSKSATESAARIFQSIQEERKHGSL